MTYLASMSVVLTLTGPAEQPKAEEAPAEAPPAETAPAPGGPAPAEGPRTAQPFEDTATPTAEPAPAPAPTDQPWTSAPPPSTQPQAAAGPSDKPDLKAPFKRGGETKVKRRFRQREWPDRPIKYRLELFLDGGTTTVFDPAYYGFDDGRNIAVLDVGFRGDARLANGRVFLGGGVGYRRQASEGSVHDDALTTGVLIREPVGLIRLSIMTIEGIDVFAEVNGGPSIVDVTVESDNSAAQRTVTGVFGGLAGITAYLPKKWLPRKGSSRITPGIEFGLGYTFRPSIDVTPTPDVDEDETIDTSTAAFGDVNFRGLTWRAGLFVRFM